MLEFQGISLRRGSRLLFSHLNLKIFSGQKVGVVGANGVGKTSLLALVEGTLDPDGGELRIPRDLRVSVVAQETSTQSHEANRGAESSLLQHILDGDEALRELEQALEGPPSVSGSGSVDEGLRLAELHANYEARDGYRARAKAQRLLAGLGFQSEDAKRPLASFSGGWRRRASLARALMTPSDVLLLDEPTNHLDLDAVVWLESWLERYPGALLLISHDRDFLDRATGHTLHIHGGQARLYRGGYSEFESQRARALAHDAAAHQRQRRAVAHLQSFVERFRYQASKAKQAQSRIKALAKMEPIVVAHLDSPFNFELQAPRSLPRPLVQTRDVALGYGGDSVLTEVRVSLNPGDRVGVLGRNGAGKSTLVRALAGGLEPQAGEFVAANDLAVGYFAQHQVEQLDLEATPFTLLEELASEDGGGGLRSQAVRDFLGGFGFSGEQALQPVESLSGGERARLTLALLVYRRPNLLVLDEPTNHLDMGMRQALEVALQDFSGALVVVAHDRHLLRTVCDELWLVDRGSVKVYTEDLDRYVKWLRETGAAETPEASDPRVMGVPRVPSQDSTPGPGAQRERRKAAADWRAQLKPLRDELARCEAALDRLQGELAQVRLSLADSGLYEQVERKPELNQVLRREGRLTQQLAEAEGEWMAAAQALEAAQGAAK